MKLNKQSIDKAEKKSALIDKENDVIIDQSKFGKFFYSIYLYLFKKIKVIRLILIWYISITLIGALLLWSPLALKDPNNPISFINALFMASSAFSDTGLVTVGVYDTFNAFGQAVLFILIQFGGIGLFAIKIFIISILFKKIRTSWVLEVQAEVGTSDNIETIGIIKVAVITNISMTLIAGTLFGIFFAVAPYSPYGTTIGGTIPVGQLDSLQGEWGKAMWTGFFHASASINNAGLDIVPGNYSLQPYFGNVALQSLTIFLFILGGMGFGIIYDVKEWIKYKSTGRKFNFSLFTKISSLTYLIVAFSGLFITYGVEGMDRITNQNSFLNISEGSEIENWWAITFNTFSTRNAGFSTIDISTMSSGTQGTWIMLMFIGSGPGSTAGGLRTTTLAILIIAAWSKAKNKSRSSIFNRIIPTKTIVDAFMIFVLATFLITISVTTIAIAENDLLSAGKLSWLDISFIVNSAFGTTGLSTWGDTLDSLQIWTKINLIIVMFIGQLGVLTFLRNLSFNIKKTKKEDIYQRYIEEDVNIGH